MLLLNAGAGCSTRPIPEGSSDPAGRKSGRLRFFDLLNLDVRDVPMLMAFEDLAGQGYTVEKTYMASGALIAAALARGDADLGLVNTQTMWTAISKGAPVRTIAGFTAPTWVLAATTAIRSCRDLDGRRMAVPTTSGLNPLLLRLYLDQDCGGAQPEYIVIVESAGRAAALLSGEVDAVRMPGEELVKLQLEAPGRFHSLASLGKRFPDLCIEGLHARRQWAEEHPGLVHDFLKALLRAQRAVVSDPERLLEEAQRRLSLDPLAAEAIVGEHLREAIWDANGGLSEKNIRETLRLLKEAAALDPGVRVMDVVDLSYLNRVLEEIGRLGP